MGWWISVCSSLWWPVLFGPECQHNLCSFISLQVLLDQLYIILRTWVKWFQREKAVVTIPCNSKRQLINRLMYLLTDLTCVAIWMEPNLATMLPACCMNTRGLDFKAHYLCTLMLVAHLALMILIAYTFKLCACKHTEKKCNYVHSLQQCTSFFFAQLITKGTCFHQSYFLDQDQSFLDQISHLCCHWLHCFTCLLLPLSPIVCSSKI